jgi:hypothetical protein
MAIFDIVYQIYHQRWILSADRKLNDAARDLRARLGPHVAPAGLYERLKSAPFAGRLSCSASEVEAGAYVEILLDYEVGSSGVADGASFKITFKFYSDWALFQTADPPAANYLTAEYRAGPQSAGRSDATVQQLLVRFDQKGHERPFQKAIIVDVVDGYLNAGDHILIRLGDRRAGGPGTRAQTFVEDQFRFRAYVDPLGASRLVAVPGDVALRIKAGAPAKVALVGPRVLRPGEAATFRASLLDRWGNIVSDHGGALDVAIAHGDAAEKQSLTLPAQGWATAGVDVAATATGEIRLFAAPGDREDVAPAEAFVSVVADAPSPRLYYADLHVHAHDTVGVNSPRYNALFARDVGGVDVFGYTANDFQITDENWRDGVAAVNALNETGRFVAYPVQEWCGSSTAGGDHKVIFLSDEPPEFPFNARGEHNRTLSWNEDMKTPKVELGRWPVEELWDAYVHAPEKHLIVPHVGGRRYIPDWHHPELERLVEIASAWGHFDWLYRDVIARGYQLGVCANSDEHRGRPGGGAPGVQVFGVRGGLTGVIADGLDRAAVGDALRARRTFATTGERTALLVNCGEHLQGAAFDSDRPARIDYRFFGDAGWDEICAFDHTGLLWRRNLHQELGYSKTRLRLRWGGARVKDRYRWAAWDGRLQIVGAHARRFDAVGFEHAEESAWRSGPGEIAFRSETYGDSDAIELVVDDLARAQFSITGAIGGFVKVGDPRRPAPFLHAPQFQLVASGAELLEKKSLRLDLGGAELFVALELMADAALPREITGSFEVDARNAPFGFRPVYLFGRQRDDAKIWSSAHFIRFAEDAGTRA